MYCPSHPHTDIEWAASYWPHKDQCYRCRRNHRGSDAGTWTPGIEQSDGFIKHFRHEELSQCFTVTTISRSSLSVSQPFYISSCLCFYISSCLCFYSDEAYKSLVTLPKFPEILLGLFLDFLLIPSWVWEYFNRNFWKKKEIATLTQIQEYADLEGCVHVPVPHATDTHPHQLTCQVGHAQQVVCRGHLKGQHLGGSYWLLALWGVL
jgi:hypothetical protein